MNVISKILLFAALTCLNSGQALAKNQESVASQAALRALGLAAPEALEMNKTKNHPVTMSLDTIFTMSARNELVARASIGGMDGGGGKILLLKDGPKTKAVVLDVYEAEKRNLTIDLGPGSTLQQKLDYVLARLSKIAPFRANAYRVWINDLLKKESEFGDDVLLPVTEDLGATMFPRNSQIVQVVVQRNEQDTKLGLARYLIDRNIFYQLDIESQAALILHEVVYREARLRGETNSLSSRYLTGVLLSKQLELINTDQFNTILSKVGSRCIELPEHASISSCRELPPLKFVHLFCGQKTKFFKIGSLREFNFATYDKLQLNALMVELFDKRASYRLEIEPINSNTPIEFIEEGKEDLENDVWIKKTTKIPYAKITVEDRFDKILDQTYFIAECKDITMDYVKKEIRMNCYESRAPEQCPEQKSGYSCRSYKIEGDEVYINKDFSKMRKIKMTADRVRFDD